VEGLIDTAGAAHCRVAIGIDLEVLPVCDVLHTLWQAICKEVDSINRSWNSGNSHGVTRGLYTVADFPARLLGKLRDGSPNNQVMNQSGCLKCHERATATNEAFNVDEPACNAPAT
jgi:hypothetical protein